MTSPMSSALVGPEANVSEQARNEFQSRLAGLGGLNGKQVSPEAKAKKLREACEGFESIFIQKMWQEMRNTVPKGGMMHGREERFWQDMYDQELSKSMTSAGGIGLADMMFEQLSRNLGAASRTTAGMGSAPAFTPEAAPLLASATEPENPEAVAGHGVSAAIYEGSASQTGYVRGEEHPEQPVIQAEVPPALSSPVTASAQAATAAPAPQQAENSGKTVAPAAKVAEYAATQQSRAARRHVHKADINNSNALELSYLARRDAGDKLGSRAVRPALRQKNHVERETGQAVGPAKAMEQANMTIHGTPESLAAALDLARSGAVQGQSGTSAMALDEVVARAQARNVARTQNIAAGQPASLENAVAANDGDSAAPVTRKVRFSSNIPTRASNKSKKGKDAIRMLNVDNVSANSRAGKGLAAYHAAQEAAAAQQPSTQPLTSQAAEAVAPAAAIAPLKPADASSGPSQVEASFSIPPLTASGMPG